MGGYRPLCWLEEGGGGGGGGGVADSSICASNCTWLERMGSDVSEALSLSKVVEGQRCATRPRLQGFVLSEGPWAGEARLGVMRIFAELCCRCELWAAVASPVCAVVCCAGGVLWPFSHSMTAATERRVFSQPSERPDIWPRSHEPEFPSTAPRSKCEGEWEECCERRKLNRYERRQDLCCLPGTSPRDAAYTAQRGRSLAHGAGVK
mmetsp:Transcript_52613/g.87359  ORF Transcript_52613/g.87359 Transcript_52613/m.87359 type:complete len:207 (-) Transcript_52613:464-1084(-)